MQWTVAPRPCDMVKRCLTAIRHGQRMLKSSAETVCSGRGHVIGRHEFHADQLVLVPDQMARADRLVDVEHDVETVGNAERGLHLQTCAGRRQIAHDAVDDRLMMVEQNARRLQRARSQCMSSFHETPPSTPVSHYRVRGSGKRYRDGYNCMDRLAARRRFIARPTPAAA